jgi:hypothetical protein
MVNVRCVVQEALRGLWKRCPEVSALEVNWLLPRFMPQVRPSFGLGWKKKDVSHKRKRQDVDGENVAQTAQKLVYKPYDRHFQVAQTVF